MDEILKPIEVTAESPWDAHVKISQTKNLVLVKVLKESGSQGLVYETTITHNPTKKMTISLTALTSNGDSVTVFYEHNMNELKKFAEVLLNDISVAEINNASTKT